ncbi:MAG: lysylphosphatidylglycerol synthase transmembrane domain-containing protein [Chloroflexota bacterium]
MPVLRALYRNRWVRYGLTVVLLALVVSRVNPQHLLTAMATVNPVDFVLAMALTVPFLYLKALRWHAMLHAAGVEASFGEAALSLIGGMGLALITPARLGELARAAYLRDRQKWKIGGLVMLDKGFDVLVLSGLSIAGATILLGKIAGLAFLLVTILGLAFVYNPDPVGRVLLRLRLSMGRRRIAEVVASLDSLGPTSSSTFLGITVLAFAVVLLQFAVILLSWRAWSPEIVFFTFPLVILTNILPVSIGGLGIREGAAALLLGHYGVPPADAALAAFLMFVVNTGLPGLVGAVLLPAISPQVATEKP